MVFVHCVLSQQHTLSLKEVSTVLELYPEQEKIIKENNSKRKPGRVKVLVYCIASQCILSF